MLSFLVTLTRFFRAIARAWRDPLFRSTLALTVALLVSGTAFYTTVERLAPLDALYLSVMTLTTVGYGDVHPVTAAGKVFTMVYVLVGVGVLVAFVTRLAQAMAREEGPPKAP
jgi:voltage-gated potassium channel Kch